MDSLLRPPIRVAMSVPACWKDAGPLADQLRQAFAVCIDKHSSDERFVHARAEPDQKEIQNEQTSLLIRRLKVRYQEQPSGT